MGRVPLCRTKEEMSKGAWTALEDKLLSDYVTRHGEGRWRTIAKLAGLKRCGKSCRLRWLNYLRPGIKRGNIQPEEEDLIIRLHRLLGNRWSLIAGRLPGRTDNEIKNYWNTILSKKTAMAAAGNNTSFINKKNMMKPSSTTTLINHKVPPSTIDKQSVNCTKVIKPNHTNHMTTTTTATNTNTSTAGAVSLIPSRNQSVDDIYKASDNPPGQDDHIHDWGETTTTTATTCGEEEQKENCYVNCNNIDCCWDNFPMDFHEVGAGTTTNELEDNNQVLFGSTGGSWNVAAAAAGSDDLWSMLNDWIMDGQGSRDTNLNKH